MAKPLHFEPERWETIPGLHVLKIVEAYASRGVDVAPTLRDCGIGPKLKANTAVDLHRASSWIEHVLERHPERGLGLAFAGLPNVLSSGIVGFTVLSSETVQEAIETRIRFGALLRPFFGISLKELESGLVELSLIELDPPHLGPRARAFCMERDLASLAGAWSFLTGLRSAFEAVEFAYPDPLLRDRYHEVFRCPSRFDRPRTLVRMRREALEIPLRHADHEASALCAEQCERMLQRMQQGSGVAASVRRELLRRPSQLSDLRQTAAALGLAERTLSRRLAAEGTSFTQVLEEVRMTLAVDYLSCTPLPIDDVAVLLGYGDDSAFSRAFKRRHGVTARAFRAREAAD
jgi:AraC-like DNA-binding protein